jgi:Ca2+-binding RTX toxin-like protein
VSGGAGADTYVLDAQSGTTTIENFDGTTGTASGFAARDIINFPSSVEDSAVQFLRERDDLIVKVVNGSDVSTTRVLSYFGAWDFSQLDIHFDDGDVTWDPNCVDFTLTQDCVRNRVLLDAIADDTDPELADDILVGYGANNTIHGGAGNDTITSFDGDDTLYGDEGNDVIDAGGGAIDILYGGSDHDRLYGGWGENTLYGEEGDDTLHAIGPFGSSLLDGGAGSDVYEVADDATVVINPLASSVDPGQDTLVFIGDLQPEELWMQVAGDDLLIRVLGSTQFFTVKDWDDADSQLGVIRADDRSICFAALPGLLSATGGVEPSPGANTALVAAHWTCP